MDNASRILVCVTPQKNSFRLIKKGSSFAKEFEAELFVIYVQRNLDLSTDSMTAKLLDELYDLTTEENGTMHVEVDADIPGTIARFIKENSITHVLLGETMASKIEKILKKDVISRITSKTEGVQFLILERAKANLKGPGKLSFTREV